VAYRDTPLTPEGKSNVAETMPSSFEVNTKIDVTFEIQAEELRSFLEQAFTAAAAR